MKWQHKSSCWQQLFKMSGDRYTQQCVKLSLCSLKYPCPCMSEKGMFWAWVSWFKALWQNITSLYQKSEARHRSDVNPTEHMLLSKTVIIQTVYFRRTVFIRPIEIHRLSEYMPSSTDAVLGLGSRSGNIYIGVTKQEANQILYLALFVQLCQFFRFRVKI